MQIHQCFWSVADVWMLVVIVDQGIVVVLITENEFPFGRLGLGILLIGINFAKAENVSVVPLVWDDIGIFLEGRKIGNAVYLFTWLHIFPLGTLEHLLQVPQPKQRAVDKGVSAVLGVVVDLLGIADIYLSVLILKDFGLHVESVDRSPWMYICLHFSKD